jgi:nucleotide-binding universal stress UspA family protein
MTRNRSVSFSEAKGEYADARRSALLRRIWTSLTGQSNELIPFEKLTKAVDATSQSYRGVRPVHMEKIIGSFGRSRDFDRAFLPTQEHSSGKWLSVDSAYNRGVTFPPISLYKIGDAYFVVDGHHRVSVARQKGQKFIDAEVTEVESKVPVSANLTLDDLDTLSAYREFLSQTKLDKLRPDQHIRVTLPGDYDKLVDHIRTHKYFVETRESRELTWEEAITHWYDNVYLPVIKTIRENDVLDEFPNHTEADLYLWIIEHAYYLSQQLGQEVAPWEAATDFVRRFSHRPKRFLSRLKNSILETIMPEQLEPSPPPGTWREQRVEPTEEEHLFRDILVTLTGAPSGWRALTQATRIVKHEDSVMHGLHVVTSDGEEELERGRQILLDFSARCQELGVEASASLVIDDDIAEVIVDRARWVDMVVINQRRVHDGRINRPLGTIFQIVASRAISPILAVPGNKVTSLKRILLAYDGSPKSNEALFVLRHLMKCWDAEGAIVTVEGANTNQSLLEDAQEYIQASIQRDVTTYYEQGTPHDSVLRIMGEEQADLLLMGGYGYRPLFKLFLGSTVDRILRSAWFPVLICR